MVVEWPSVKWQQLVDNRRIFFWVLHTAGWLGYGVANYLGSLFYEKEGSYLILISFSAVSGWLLTLPLRPLFRRAWNLSPLKLVSTVLVSAYLVGVTWAVLKNINYWEVYKDGNHPESWVHYTGYSVGSFLIVLCWSGLYFGIKYYQMLQQERQKALKATNMAHQAQLKMLRYQLNPHFLFNTLNAISTLILIKENEAANGMVSRLSDFLRYSLDKDPIKRVTLSQEVDALNLYLDIEKVRFEDRLHVEIDIDPACSEALVPSMILQPLIENAIKYAIAVKEADGTIWIKVSSFGADLLIEVADNGPGATIVDGQLSREGGVGLANTRERLHSLYGDNYAFVLSDNRPSGLKINLRLPLELTSYE